MQKLKPHNVNKLNNFISGWYIDNNKFCDDIIELHKNHPDKISGIYTKNNVDLVDKSIKDSTDLALIADIPLHDKFITEILQNCVNHYIEQYPYCNHYAAFGSGESPNIQHYFPDGGYKVWHTERTCATFPSAARHLVYILYLNDVEDEGETEFFHQNIKIKPEKGLLVIWPTDWTFTHRGIPSPSQEKYILTGWLHYYNKT